MTRGGRQGWIAGATVTSLGTLGSRVLGMVRDMATAALLGLAGSGVMDAFVVAFRVPNLFRRLLGEGALAAGYVPVLAEALERDRTEAWYLARKIMLWIGAISAAAVLVAEIGFGVLALCCQRPPETTLALGLGAVLMPYVLLASLAALMAASLQCLGEFALPAATPMLLNVCWLVAAWGVAPHFVAKQSQAYVLAFSVLVAGALQVAVQWARLRQHGFQPTRALVPAQLAASEHLRQILARLGPMGFGMAVTQINALLASLLAWLLTAPVGPVASDRAGSATALSPPMASTPDDPNAAFRSGLGWRPLDRGAAAALYYAERVYEFPLGMIGVAAGTAMFPLLSRQAARGQHREFSAALTLGLQWVMFLGIPASAGLILLADPLVRLLFERGAFSADDALRTARVIRLSATGIWAYCAVPVMVRAYYALGEMRAPVRIGALAILWNLAVGAMLVGYLAEGALALAGATAAVVQMVLLGAGLLRSQTPPQTGALAATAARALAAAGAMFLAGRLLLTRLNVADTTAGRLIAVTVPLGVCLAVYLGTYVALGGRLFTSGNGPPESGTASGPSEP